MFDVLRQSLVAIGVWTLATPILAQAQDTRCRIDSTAPWAMVNRTWSNETGRTWSNDSVRRVLLSLVKEDQEIRRDYASRVQDTTYLRTLIETDRRLSASVKEILDRFGLPTRSMVGSAGSTAAFRVVQHSESLQVRVLTLARQVPQNEVPPESMATLEDRVLVRQGRPQRFATQFSVGSDGMARFAPNEDSAGLAARRAAAGLMPMDVYVCLIEESGLRVDRSSLPPS